LDGGQNHLFGQGNLLRKVDYSRRLEAGWWAQSVAKQAKAFQVAGGDTIVAQMSFASQVPLAWQMQRVDDLIADRFSSKQISEEPVNLSDQRSELLKQVRPKRT
jgi:hypothetical protein